MTEEKHIKIRESILQCQVCSKSTIIAEALEWLRTTSPSGTINNWQIDERAEVAPVDCDDIKDRKHYVFVT